ncbi:hypothetical protein FRC04_006952 [Tulasnella sp. 424]|nr:hypothetical protein FRC04_006952 [Tulasnella sp. 424]
MADSNLPLSTPEINDTILQIRSVSTILSKLFPNAGEGVRAQRDARLRTLDDLSILFVRGSSDVVAVATLVANNCITLKTVHTAAHESGLNVIGSGGAECVENITPEEHARYVQYLLRDLYAVDNRTSEQKELNLRFYIYSYCIAKVHNRFTAKIPGFEGSYHDFFLADGEGKVGKIGKDVFNTENGEFAKTPAPSKVGGRDETWILNLLPELKNIPGWRLSTGTPATLELRQGQAWHLWSFVGGILEKLLECIIYVHQNLQLKYYQGLLREQKREKLAEMKHNLDLLDSAMQFLENLVRASPTFWRLVASISGLLGERRGARKLSLHSWTNESDGRDRIEDEAIDDELERNFWGDGDSPPAQLRRWLKSLTQWPRAMGYLEKGQKKLGILTQHLTITASVAPPPTQPERQASLRRTLEPLARSNHIGVEDMLGLIRRRATEVFTSDGRNPPQKSGPPKCLVNASDEQGSEWETQFEGHIHCEAYLAARLQPPNGGQSLVA